MRQIKHKSFMSYLYVALMCLPFIAILSRIIYVQTNKNAYQSYSGETQQNGTYANIQYNDMNIGSEYYTFVNQPTWFDENASSMYINVSNVKNYGPMNYQNGITYNLDEVDYITVWFPQNNNRYIIAFELHKTGESQYYYINSINAFNFSFTYEGASSVNDNAKALFSNYLYKLEYIDKNYLDNVFDYSVNKFIENNNFGNMDLTGFIANLFLPSNQVNNLYIHFLNWYLNYALFTSVVYLMFAVLMWFVNYSRRLLDRGMNYDF